jgi:hypothetical protein
MDSNSEAVAEALQTLASCGYSLRELAISLRKHPKVNRIQDTLEFHQYQTGSAIEGYVDVEMHDGRAICWWIDIQWQDMWKINSRVYLNDSQGQKTIHEFHERHALDFDTYIREISNATQELVEFDALALAGYE